MVGTAIARRGRRHGVGPRRGAPRPRPRRPRAPLARRPRGAGTRPRRAAPRHRHLVSRPPGRAGGARCAAAPRLGAAPAAAHASLVSIDPADGARLDESPEVVTLTFSEPVSVGLGGVRVLDADGDPVQDGAAARRRRGRGGRPPAGPPRRHLRRQLPRHLRRRAPGARRLRVRGRARASSTPAPPGRVAGDSDDRTWEVVGAVGRGLAYAGVLLAAGGVAFLVARPSGRRRTRSPAAHRARRARPSAPSGCWWRCRCRPRSGPGRGRRRSSTTACSREVAEDGVGLGVLLAPRSAWSCWRPR